MTTTTTRTRTTYPDLLRNYEQAVRNRMDYGIAETEAEFTEALQLLAKFCTFSVLKKLSSVGRSVKEDESKDGKAKPIAQRNAATDSTQVIRDLRRDLMNDLDELERLRYATDNATTYRYKKDGDIVTVVLDKELKHASDELAGKTLSDGMDLYQEASKAILEITAEIDDYSGEFMETPRLVVRENKRIRLKDEDAKDLYREEYRSPIQDVFMAVRQVVRGNRSVQVANDEYTYLEEVIINPYTGEEDTVYRRLSKYSGLATEVMDYNGKVVAVTADREAVDRVDELIEAMNLTPRQIEVLQRRLRPEMPGYKAIARSLHVTQRAVAKTISKIQKKARETDEINKLIEEKMRRRRLTLDEYKRLIKQEMQAEQDEQTEPEK